MVRKNRQQKNSKIKTESTCSKIDINKSDDNEAANEANTSENIVVTSDDKTRFSCTVCDQLFKYETGLKKHKLRHKPPGGFVCSECNARFVTDAERLLHKEVVHKIFKCMICHEKCTSEEAFSNHINSLHDGRDREFVFCADCGAQFRQKNQLRLHCESKCGTLRCYTCNQCDSKFMTQNTLNAHMLIHTGEKKHLCNFCGNSFLSRGQLKIHERSHTKEKPYKCLVCNKAFAHRESLVTHSSLHTGIKPYKCECCCSQFSCIGNLIKHRRIRPQTCGLPKYSNVKCAPRASTKVPGSLTIKKERVVKRSYAKRKVIAVPELLSERAELTGQFDNTKVEPDDESQEFAEYLILNKQKPDDVYESTNLIKSDEDEIEPQTGNLELLNSPPSGTISYNIPKSSVLVLTADGNYMIANLDNDVKQPHEIRSPPPQVEQIIILNSSDLQFAEMEVDGQANDRVIDENGSVAVLHTTTSSTDPISGDDQIDELVEPQYVENSIQHLEIVPAEAEIDGLINKTEDTNNSHTSEIFECEVCLKPFKQEKTLIKHLDTKHNIECDFIKKEWFKCKYCYKQYSKESLLNKHILCHGTNGELRYKCSCCTRYFDTKEKMQEHALKEHEDRLKCNFCNKIYKELDCKTAHIRKVHMKTGAPQKRYTFVCSRCGKKFNSRVALGDHEQADCGRMPLYKCDYENCGKSLHSLGSLKIHQLIHTGHLPYSCNFCKKKFRTQGQVKVHERSHNGDKPFKCNQCPKAFAHRESLLTHLSLHTGLKRFGCQGCGSRFSCISNLQAHRRTHQNTCGQLPLDTRAQYSYNVDDGIVNSTNATS